MQEPEQSIIGQIVYDKEVGFIIQWNGDEIKLDDPEKWEEIAYALDVCQSVMEELVVFHNMLKVMMERDHNEKLH
tara:strand:- start:429 stop:653 length:225 start_codon:yes stop_codon:yes gene_type:complete